MSHYFHNQREDYYRKFMELQEKLRKSEQERLKLEMQLNEILKVTRDEEQMYVHKLHTQYKKFLDEDKKLRERNENILKSLDRIESKVAMITAKTESLKLLRQKYHGYLQKLNKTIPTPNVAQSTPSYTHIYTAKSYSTPALPKFDYTFDTSPPSRATYSTISGVDCTPRYNFTTHDFDLPTTFNTSPTFSTSHKYNWEASNYPQLSTEDLIKKSTQYGDFINNSYSTKFTSSYDSLSSDEDYEATPPPRHEFKEIKDYNDDRIKKYEIELKFRYPYKVRDDQAKMCEAKERMNELLKKYRSNYTYNKNQKSKEIRKFDEINKKLNDLLRKYKTKKEINRLIDEINLDEVNNDRGDRNTLSDLEQQILKKKYQKEILDNILLQPDPNIERPKLSQTTPRVRFENYQNEKDVNGKCEDEIENPKYKESEKSPERTESEEKLSELVHNYEENNGEEEVNEETVEEEEKDVDQSTHLAKDVEQEKETNETEEELIKNDEKEQENPVKEEENKENVQYDPGAIEDQSETQSKDNEDDQKEAYEEKAEFNENHEQTPCEEEKQQNQQEEEQPVQHENSDQRVESEKELEQVVKNDEQEQPVQYDDTNYDENGQSIQYNEMGQPLQYDEGGQSVQYDETGQPIQYDENGQAIQYDENGQTAQYDENGQPIQYNEAGESVQYDENGQPIQYDENGQLLQYDQNGQPLQYDQSGQPLQYDQNGQPIHYDENGQPLQYDQSEYDQSGQYDENGQPIQYDENGQPISNQQLEYNENVQYDENGQPLQYTQQYDENGQPLQYDDDGGGGGGDGQSIQETNEPEKGKTEETKANVMEMLDTDTESIAKDVTKASNDSDFDFSNA